MKSHNDQKSQEIALKKNEIAQRHQMISALLLETANGGPNSNMTSALKGELDLMGLYKQRPGCFSPKARSD